MADDVLWFLSLAILDVCPCKLLHPMFCLTAISLQIEQLFSLSLVSGTHSKHVDTAMKWQGIWRLGWTMPSSCPAKESHISLCDQVKDESSTCQLKWPIHGSKAKFYLAMHQTVGNKKVLCLRPFVGFSSVAYWPHRQPWQRKWNLVAPMVLLCMRVLVIVEQKVYVIASITADHSPNQWSLDPLDKCPSSSVTKIHSTRCDVPLYSAGFLHLTLQWLAGIRSYIQHFYPHPCITFSRDQTYESMDQAIAIADVSMDLQREEILFVNWRSVWWSGKMKQLWLHMYFLWSFSQLYLKLHVVVCSFWVVTHYYDPNTVSTHWTTHYQSSSFSAPSE